MTVLRVAVRVALSRDGRQRWRQLSVAVSALLALLCLALGVAVVSASEGVEARLSARMPVVATEDDSEAFVVSERGVAVDGREVSLRWIEPVPGHEHDPAIVPPGLTALPEPGEAVVSPGLVRVGVTPSELGFEASTAGSGPGGTIGPAGVGTQDELIAWIRPAEGRSLGEGGTLIGFVRFPTTTDLATLGQQDDLLVGDYPMPRGGELRMLVGLLIVLPALVMLGLGARARSEVRTDRSEFLLRLGIPRGTVRGLLALEGSALGLVGAAIGALVAFVAALHLTTLPLSGTVFAPGAFRVGAGTLGLLVVLVVAVVGVVSAMGALRPSVRERRPRRAGAWRLAPIAAGLASIVATAFLPVDGTGLFYLGVVALLVAIPYAVPSVARLAGARLGRTAGPPVWLAASRVVHDPVRTSRVAVLLALTVYLGATSVAVLNGQTAVANSTASVGGAAYSVNWRDARDGDLETLARGVSGETADAVVLPMLSTVGDDGLQQVVVADCAVLRPVEPQFGVPVCTPAGSLSDEAKAVFEEAFMVDAVAQAGSPATGAAANGAATGATKDPNTDADGSAVDAALVLAPHGIDDVDLYRAGSGLPAFNPSELLGNTSVRNPIGAWIAAGWAIALAVLACAIFRELTEYSRDVQRDGSRLVRLGLSRPESERAGRWTVLIPVLATVPIAYVCGLVTSFFGVGPRITRYTPVWISLYTCVTLAIVGGAILVGLALSRPAARER